MSIKEDERPAAGRDTQVQALARGLEVLEHLVASGGSVSGVELGRRTGLHPSSVSRILATLTSMGYTRKVGGAYNVDYGVLNFVQAATSIDAITRAQKVIEGIAQEQRGCTVNLCTLRRGRVIYLIRSMADHETMTATSLPLQQSSAAMRLLVTLGFDEGLTALQRSRERHGWTGGDGLPDDEEAAMTWALQNVDHDVLILRHWSGNSVSGAIPVASTDSGFPMAVAIGGPRLDLEPMELRLLLHDARRQVERALWWSDSGVPENPGKGASSSNDLRSSA